MEKKNTSEGLSHEELICWLIKADMSNYKLLSGLRQTGLALDSYFDSDLALPVLLLIGFNPIDDQLYTFYDNYIKRISKAEPSSMPLFLHQLSQELYLGLLQEKNKRLDN